MLKNRRFPMRMMLRWGLPIGTLGAAWSAIVYAVYVLSDFQWLRVPFLPIATVGTAVAFYVGFKNNAAYDRFWEGRKIWGGIVNASRTWAMMVLSYIEPTDDGDRARETRRLLIYRQLAWVNALRLQLRRTSRFFDKPAPPTRKRLEAHAVVMRNDWEKELSPFLSESELDAVTAQANSATHLLLSQGKTVAGLVSERRLDLFHQIQMMEIVQELYALQGKSERIKATPFPRQYAEFSRWFTRVFVVLLPFGMLDVFAARTAGHASVVEMVLSGLPMVVACGVVTWVFVTMEGIGDSSEDPFERSMNDVPMNALSITIERDLRQMLGETEIPDPEPVTDSIQY